MREGESSNLSRVTKMTNYIKQKWDLYEEVKSLITKHRFDDLYDDLYLVLGPHEVVSKEIKFLLKKQQYCEIKKELKL